MATSQLDVRVARGGLMDRKVGITDAVFAASLQCQRKAHLLYAGETSEPDELSRLECEISARYEKSARATVQATLPDTHLGVDGIPLDLVTQGPAFLRIGRSR